MQYAVHHVTHFRYEHPVSESIMEVRMRPRNDQRQRCYAFSLDVEPATNVFWFEDGDKNLVHHFNIPNRHDTLKLTAESVVEVKAHPLPDRLAHSAWDALDALFDDGQFWSYTHPTALTQPSDLLSTFASELDWGRRADPLSLLKALTATIRNTFDYDGQATHVHSPIDDALANRKGVCQDFAHIFIALARQLSVPCRYVSGYLFHNPDSDQSADDATHAWAEAYLPELGWVGFDPTNNLVVDDRHIRVAVGRDYRDVPPTRGIFKGDTTSALEVGVRVVPSAMTFDEQWSPVMVAVRQDSGAADETTPLPLVYSSQQQQQ
ncbi:MAG: transglutaminase family protein [Rhodothermales bacterium]